MLNTTNNILDPSLMVAAAKKQGGPDIGERLRSSHGKMNADAVSRSKEALNNGSVAREKKDVPPVVVQSGYNPDSHMKVDIHHDSGRFMYLFVDNSSGEVEKQLPRKYMLEQFAYMREIYEKTLDDTV